MADGQRSLGWLTPQIVLGTVVVGIGLVFLAANFDLVDAGQVLGYWPLALVAMGLAVMLRSCDRSGQTFGGILLVVGVWLTAEHAFGLRVEFWDWWPLVLVLFGVLLILRGRSPHGPASAAPSGTLSEVAFWSAVKRRITSTTFQRADLTAIMGGVEMDFRQAATAGEAVIDVFVLWGGVEITVPPDWAVSNRIVAIMGGADDKSTGAPGARNQLTVRGFVLMGGVEIKT